MDNPVEGPNIIYEVASASTAPCERDRSTGKSLFKEWLVVCPVLDDAVSQARHFCGNGCERLALSIGIERIGSKVSLIFSAELVFSQMDGTFFVSGRPFKFRLSGVSYITAITSLEFS